MLIEYMTLEQFRSYPHACFHFHPRFTVLIGENGSGKTTLLDALAILVGTYFQGSGIPVGKRGIASEDIRYHIEEKGGQSFREPVASAQLEAQARMGEEVLRWKRVYRDRAGEAKDLVNWGKEQREAVKKGGSPHLPLLVYYGAGRLWNTHKVTAEKPGSQLDAYRYCLDPSSDQKAFQKWFRRYTYSELQLKETNPALECVRTSVCRMIPGAIRFYHDTRSDEIRIELENHGIIPFGSLSDGYRNMAAMVADMAYRSVHLNPHFGADAADLIQGVVLIDEIDLHLHPKWQRRVVGDLKTVFPKLQFIATTHSPFILQSLEPGEVIDLSHDTSNALIDSAPSGVAAPGPGHSFSDRSIEDIVEEIMGVSLPQRSHRLQEMYDVAQKYYELLENVKTADEPRLADLKQQLDILIAPYSENVAYHAFLETERKLAEAKGKSG